MAKDWMVWLMDEAKNKKQLQSNLEGEIIEAVDHYQNKYNLEAARVRIPDGLDPVDVDGLEITKSDHLLPRDIWITAGDEATNGQAVDGHENKPKHRQGEQISLL